ncbi:MAG: glycoside hydrolase family 57 protein [Candidatus Omnitrophica bacterium]|nr:glycoside hydrolase family 57 protein [Candidatus Omnitrophota bacterium]
MLYLAFIFHMHQPYYKNLLTQESDMPWVRLHGVKDYLDMLQILQDYPLIHQTFNLVPSLLEQIEDYTNRRVKDKFLELSYKPAKELTPQEKEFILKNFFSINIEKVISIFPRYYELYFKRQRKSEFSPQDYLDLQACFNLAWIDPVFRQKRPELSAIADKARFFSEEEKQAVLRNQEAILEEIIPSYKQFMRSSQVELTVSPYYHPILPLLYNTNTAKEANPKTILPKLKFAYPQDAQAQIKQAVQYFKSVFEIAPCGMWPSEEAVSEHILPFIIQAGLNWIVTDEAILFKSLKLKKREIKLLYQPHLIKRKEGALNIIFRDRNLSDLISFVYQGFKTEAAVADLMGHLENIARAFGQEDILVTIAMDGENAWEYYANDGADFLNLLYQRLSDSKIIKAVTISEYLKTHPPKSEIKRLAAGSWIYAQFSKWINNPYKNKAWEYLAEARKLLEELVRSGSPQVTSAAWKQMYICEGSDWFWWYGEEDHGDFDRLFRMHLANFYTLIGKTPPDYLKKPLTS